MIYTARNACAINTAGVWRGGRDIDRSIRGEVLKGTGEGLCTAKTAAWRGRRDIDRSIRGCVEGPAPGEGLCTAKAAGALRGRRDIDRSIRGGGNESHADQPYYLRRWLRCEAIRWPGGGAVRGLKGRWPEKGCASSNNGCGGLERRARY